MRERPDKREPERPQLTYGELRRRLEEAGDPWSIDPTISDEELVPQYPTGGQAPEAEEFRAAAMAVEPKSDIRDVIAELPPTDPDLRRHWEEAGLPLDREVREETSDRLPDEGSDRRGGER